MKKNLCAIAFLAFSLFLTACNKNLAEPSSDPGNTDSSGAKTGNLVRIRQGVSIDDDTVYLLRYDVKNRLASITDSIYKDSVVATYDDNDRIVQVDGIYEGGSDHAYYTYNSSGQLTQMDSYLAGTKSRYAFTWSGSMPSSCTYSTDEGMGGGLYVWRTFNYTVTGNNITGIKEYSNASALVGERKISFGSKPNAYKNISLFNFENYLGMQDIAPLESAFNANVAETTDMYGDSDNLGLTIAVQSSYNTAGNPTGTVATEKYPDATLQSVFTWAFSYK